MDTLRTQQNKSRSAARYQSITEEEMLNEGEYDDMWRSARQPSSARRYQGMADVRTETGRTADVQNLPTTRRTSISTTGAQHAIPTRRGTTQGRLPAIQTTPPTTRVPIETDQSHYTPIKTEEHTPRLASGRRLHWSVFIGVAILIMIFGWITLGALGTWWQTTTDDWRYGRPRTFQTTQVTGNHDSAQNPSHFIAMNLNRHIVIIEIPGGDVSKSIVFSGPTLLGPGQDLAPVTLTFSDVNHDGKIDMIVNVQGSQFVFLNENGTFVAPTTSSANPG